MNSLHPDDGLYSTKYNINSVKAANRLVSFGATGDSFYEYLVKAWIQVRTRLISDGVCEERTPRDLPLRVHAAACVNRVRP